MYLTPLLWAFTLELDNSGWPQESRMMGLPGRERSLALVVSVSLSVTTVTVDR